MPALYREASPEGEIDAITPPREIVTLGNLARVSSGARCESGAQLRAPAPPPSRTASERPARPP